MNKQYGLIVSCCIFVSVFMLGFSAAYARDSINTFKSVANEAEEIRSQYKERQNYLQEKKNLKQAKDTVDAYNKEIAGNRDEVSKVKNDIEDVDQKQAEHLVWIEKNQKMIDRRAPRLNTANEYAERMQYLDGQIAGHRYLIAKKERRVEEYNRRIAALAGQIADADPSGGDASFDEKTKAVLTALERVEYASDRLDEANALKIQLLGGKILPDYDENAEKQNEAVNAEVENLEHNANHLYAELERDYQLERDLYAIKDRMEAMHDLEENKEDLTQYQAELDTYYQELLNEIKTVEDEIKQLERTVAHKRYGHYLSASMEYYSYSGDGGYDGHQFYMPVSYFMEHGYHEFGVSFAFVNTSADFGSDGSESMNGMTDVSLHYGYRQARDTYTIKYMLDVDIPVGDSETGDYALSDDLVPVTRLSEGLNIRPGIEFYYHNDDYNVYKAVFGYNFKGNYDYNNRPGAYVNPGDALESLFSWTHAEEDHQFRLGVEPTFNTKTNGDNLSYREGMQMFYKAMYNKKLSETSDLMGYYWLRTNNADSYDYPAGTDSSSSNVHYYGLEYKYSPSERHTWFIRNNNMSSFGDYYDPVTGERISDRRKHVLGVGYDFNMNEAASIGLGMNGYLMKDKDPDKDYDGTEFLLWFNKSF